MTNKNSILFFIGLIVFLIFTRFFLINRIPIGISHDEIEYILSAKTYWLLGKDISGIKFPQSLLNTQTEGRIAELPSLLLSPFFGPFSLNKTIVKIPFLLISIATGVVLFFLIYELFHNYLISFFGLFLVAINPWFVFWGRTAFEANIAQFFYLLAILIFLKKPGNLFSLFFFALGFFSYHGYKILFIPIILILIIYGLVTQKKQEERKKIGWYALLSFLFIFLYALIVFYHGQKEFGIASRQNDLVFLNFERFSVEVDRQRRMSLGPAFLKKFFNNKGWELYRFLFKRYLLTFSPEMLFISGNDRAVYTFIDHGLFYPFEGLLFFLGLFFLFLKDKIRFYLLVSLILISSLPSVLSTIEISYMLRSSFMYPFLIILGAYGLYCLATQIRNKKTSRIFIMGIIIVYTISFLNFFYFYLFRFPFVNPESFFFSERILARYLKELPKDKPILVSAPTPRSVALLYLFYTNQIEKKDVLGNYLYPSGTTIIKKDNITFSADCPNKNFKREILIVHWTNDCKMPENNLFAITSLKDAGEIYRIYNDESCLPYYQKMSRYISDLKLNDFDIENISRDEFCQKWISKIERKK